MGGVERDERIGVDARIFDASKVQVDEHAVRGSRVDADVGLEHLHGVTRNEGETEVRAIHVTRLGNGLDGGGLGCSGLGGGLDCGTADTESGQIMCEETMVRAQGTDLMVRETGDNLKVTRRREGGVTSFLGGSTFRFLGLYESAYTALGFYLNPSASQLGV